MREKLDADGVTFHSRFDAFRRAVDFDREQAFGSPVVVLAARSPAALRIGDKRSTPTRGRE